MYQKVSNEDVRRESVRLSEMIVGRTALVRFVAAELLAWLPVTIWFAGAFRNPSRGSDAAARIGEWARGALAGATADLTKQVLPGLLGGTDDSVFVPAPSRTTQFDRAVEANLYWVAEVERQLGLSPEHDRPQLIVEHELWFADEVARTLDLNEIKEAIRVECAFGATECAAAMGRNVAAGDAGRAIYAADLSNRRSHALRPLSPGPSRF